MSNPAVTFGCPLLPSTVADPPSILGVRARRRFADPKGTAYGGSAFSSHLRRIILPRNPVNQGYLPRRMRDLSCLTGGLQPAQEVPPQGRGKVLSEPIKTIMRGS